MIRTVSGFRGSPIKKDLSRITRVRGGAAAASCADVIRLKHSVYQNPEKQCLDPGSNWRPSDLQSDALPTELQKLRDFRKQLCKHLFSLH